MYFCEIVPYRFTDLYVSSQYCTRSQSYTVPVCFFAILYQFTDLPVYVSSQYCTGSQIYMFLRNILSVHRFICFFANCTSSEIYTFLRNILSVSSSAMLHRSLSYICNFATVAIQLSNVSRSLTTGVEGISVQCGIKCTVFFLLLLTMVLITLLLLYSS